ncbi:hypothetical protein GGX14DRAFT_13797 [Mycena pura]|uniref:Uncharacterized protein n=1 Tax=Mycena pura TaxID=153505 RepID=A0AAD6UT08_9AGAR|nr:hypothetical protein GGX14DRAFT_13797 [Mycena pura]
MSLKEPVAEQRHADGVATAAVGHAAPLRAKIAQFESKGGVPVPRGSESFGFGAPPVVDRGQQRPGQLYGNRMKPVWVPAIPGRSSQAARVWDDRAKDAIRRMQGVTREESRVSRPVHSRLHLTRPRKKVIVLVTHQITLFSKTQSILRKTS